ncbi:type II toxin-antitoxin system Phd/YefM family antitoxin [Geodermatophilus chilensis]|uniref:type II toxin-antitoxin system Phd/YefM family antitoxin n=1 Tax=Geodermatophilus chilensis TaxID=2035835 RepID=UPI001E634362|nr:type II toxin-antitoxin system Phd/YefM family antitoxin [Geodermatophilus chilensis]
MHQPVYLGRRGRRVVAVIAADDLERLQALAEEPRLPGRGNRSAAPGSGGCGPASSASSTPSRRRSRSHSSSRSAIGETSTSGEDPRRSPLGAG